MKKPNTKIAWFWVFVLVGFFLGLLIATAECADITLSWDAPTTNADGTPLADLAGYKVYMGNQSGQYTQTFPINSACSATGGCSESYKITNLSDGTYCFVVTALDASGNESAYSNEVCTTIDTTAPGAPSNLHIQVLVASGLRFKGVKPLQWREFAWRMKHHRRHRKG